MRDGKLRAKTQFPFIATTLAHGERFLHECDDQASEGWSVFTHLNNGKADASIHVVVVGDRSKGVHGGQSVAGVQIAEALHQRVFAQNLY